MLPPDLALQVRLLVELPKLPEAAATDRITEVAKLQPGEAVTARVLGRQSDGQYKLAAAGRSITLPLPTAAQPGDRVRLVFLGAQSNPAFALAASPQSSATLSPTGQFAATLTAGGPRLAAPVAAAPLFETPPTTSGEIAPRLREALTLSGLFYESHQAQWVEGERPLQQLLREPQGRLSPLIAQEHALSTGRLDAAAPAPALPTTNDDVPATANTLTSPAHPDTLPVVQQQLGALETGELVWQGQLWPGQPMHWSLRELADEHHAGAEQQRAWETQVSLALTQLGSINATLRLQSNGVTIALTADDASNAQRLQQRSAELVNAMNAAGLSVSTVHVHRHAAP
jgi:hypothetical protein